VSVPRVGGTADAVKQTHRLVDLSRHLDVHDDEVVKSTPGARSPCRSLGWEGLQAENGADVVFALVDGEVGPCRPVSHSVILLLHTS